MTRSPSWLCVLMMTLTSLAGCLASGAGLDSSVQGDEEKDSAQAGSFEGDDPGYVTGVVVDTELVPILEVDIIVRPGDHITLTNAAGRFRVGPLEPGTYTVIAEKIGYKDAEATVEVREDRPTSVTLTIEPNASDVPYHETVIRTMFLYCAVAIAPPTTVRVPCAGVVDIALQTATGQRSPNTLDTWTFDFKIERPGFASLVMEMVWPPQQLGQNALMQLSKLARAQANTGGSVTIGGTVYGGHMAQPYHDVIHAGNLYVTNKANVFYPAPNATEEFQMLVSVYEGNTTTGHGVFISWRPTVYLSFFYNRQASHEFTILPDR